MAQEASKARDRVEKYLRGRILDIGAGSDLIMPDAETWDVDQGDAQLLSTLPHESFDTVFSSHCLEHMRNPLEAILNWWRVLKPGGYMIVLMPDEDLYEQHVWPSVFNDDHKVSLTSHKHNSWSPVSCNVLDLVKHLTMHKLISINTLDKGFQYGLPHLFDQTKYGAEVSIELVLYKQLPEDGKRMSKFEQVAYCPKCRASMILQGMTEDKGLQLQCTKCGVVGECPWPFNKPKDDNSTRADDTPAS